jgi:hypothetical protein
MPRELDDAQVVRACLREWASLPEDVQLAVLDADLKRGANELRLKVTQGGGGWAAWARIVGTDGLAIAGLKAQAER